MRIEDLTIPDKSLPRDLITALEKKGFVVIGSGNFSVVLDAPTHAFVIKVTMIEDKGWNTFAEWASVRSNPYLPKIYKISKFTHRKVGYTATFMEPLTQATSLPRGMITFCDNIDVYIDRQDPRDQMQPSDAMDFKDFVDRNPELVDLLIDIESLKPHCLDIHRSNVMMRANRQLVITDPLL